MVPRIIALPSRAQLAGLLGELTTETGRRQEAVEGLRVSEERNRLLVENVVDYAIFMLDPQGVVTNWNRGAQRIKGYRTDEIVGRHFSVFYTEADRAAGVPQRALETAAREGKFEVEAQRVRKDGSLFWANVVIDPIHDADGRLVGYAKVTRDITERVKAQAALRESEQRFRLLVNGVVDYALFMLDAHGVVTNWNPGAARIKGWRADEIVGRHFSVFYTPEDRAAGMPERALEIAAREGRFETEALRVRKDGTQFWANVVIDALRDDAGRVIGFAKITRDVTERVTAAQALEDARARLAQAQKMEAVGQLTGGIAHDFNNLLTAILGSISLALDDSVPVDPQLRPLLLTAVRACERGAELTRSMLAFSRRQVLSPAVIDLNKTVGGMSELLRRTLGEAIGVQTVLAGGLWRANLDPNQLESAVLNLALNARDAMPGGGKLTIETANVYLDEDYAAQQEEVTAGQYVLVAVTDT
ncbi:MAG: PAS domain S-box protein, partial [Alphaproteobacteria bacterium]|nr:PAS domain S-box protein [Alphaproteobacteria bacterium]